MLIVFFIVVLISNVYLVTGRCVYENYDQMYPPVFTQEFGAKEIILKPSGQPLTIDEGSSINAYCDNNFTTSIFEYSRSTRDNGFGFDSIDSDSSSKTNTERISNVQVKCSKGKLYYYDGAGQSTEVGNKNLTCHNSQPGLFPTYYHKCAETGTGMVYGFTVKGKQVVLARLCYNADGLEVFYIHHDSENHERTLDDHERPDVQFDSNTRIPINFIESNEQRSKNLNEFLGDHYDSLKALQFFRFDHLVPMERLSKGFSYDRQILERPISIPWYSNLKDSNWKMFEEALEKQNLLDDYEIFTGIAHSATVEINGEEYFALKAQLEEERRKEQHIIEEQRRQEAIRMTEDRERQRIKDEQERLELKRQEWERRQLNQSYPSYVPGPKPYQNPARRTQTVHLNQFNSPQQRRRKRSEFDISELNGQDVHYMSGSVVRTIPRFIWTHVKSRFNTTSSTVVIAINSPFVDAGMGKNIMSLEFCNMNYYYQCPSWLKEYERTWKMPALGYMFCCDPEEAKQFIREIQ